MPLFFYNPTVFLYFLLSIVFTSIAYISIRVKSKALDNVNFVFVFLMALCFYGLRYPGTVDTRMYLEHFDALSDFIHFEWGIGFYWLMLSIKTLNDSHDGYVFLSSLYLLISFSILIFYFCRDKYYKSLYLISLFYSGSILDLATNTYRQGIAVPFVALFSYALIKKKYMLSILCGLIALELHWNSAFVLLLSVIGIILAKYTKILKYVSVGLFLIFTFSFMLNLNIAENVARLPLLHNIQSAFFGVNLLSKVDAYLGAGVDGADFYQMNILQRLRNTGEIYIAFVVNMFFLLSIKKSTNIEYLKELNYIQLYGVLTVLIMYGVLLISMTWFIRNFYWVTSIIFINYIIIMRFYEVTNYNKFKKLLILYCFFQVIYSVAGMWRLPFLTMSYPPFY